jgi:hypothetical protein
MQESEKADANASGTDWNKAYEYVGYISGVYDAIGFLFNLPARVTKGQIMAVVAKYLRIIPPRSGASLPLTWWGGRSKKHFP